MKVSYLKCLLGLLGSLGLSNTVFAQANNYSSNMQLGNTVGIYANQNSATNNMQLPAQIGTYQGQGTTPNGTMVNYGGTVVQGMPIRPRRVVNYDLPPTMNDNLYSEVKGYQTPNRYTLGGAKRFGNTGRPSGETEADSAAKQLNAMMEEYGTEYFLSLSYGFSKFDGKGLTNKDINFPPVNNIDNKMDDPKALSVGFGVMYNRGLSLSVNYTNLSGLKYGKYSYTENQWCGLEDDDFYFDCTDENSVRGGGINSNALMINARFNIPDIVKNTWLENYIIPYVSVGAGIAFNTVDDFDVTDEYGPEAELPLTDDGAIIDDEGYELAGFFQDNGLVSHFGSTKSGLAYNIELGATIMLDKKTMLDVYIKHADFGTVETKDTVYYNYDEYEIVYPIIDDLGNLTCTEQALNEGFEYDEEYGFCTTEPTTIEGFETDAKEKGKIAYNEIGARLRLIF